MIKLIPVKEGRICQGDIFKDVEYVEYAVEKSGIIEISKIIFPLVIVLTQDCDLKQDFTNRAEAAGETQDKHLLSVIVAPLYNAEHVYNGEHLSYLSLKMQDISKGSKTYIKLLKKNQLPRYHYLEFEDSITSSIIDFKHYFAVNVELLLKSKSENFIFNVPSLAREQISQRFANFLSRIGLPL